MYRTLGVLIVALGLSVSVVRAQSVVLTGTVMDNSGAVLPGASVVVFRGNVTVASVGTKGDGTYQVNIPAGEYQLEVRLEGFSAATATVLAGPDTVQDFQLGLAPVNDSVVVTASRTEQSRATVTESLSVFTTEDIEALGSPSLAEVVQQIPGLNVESTGREGSIASLFSRGGESDYNHVLIDGVRVNVSGGQFDFSRVSGTEIERVEVVRGAQSALYGSDAIGSVIQIFTKRGAPTDAPRVYGSLEGGSFNTVRSDFRVLGGAQQRLDYQLGFAYRGSDGAFKDRLPDRDRFDQSSVDGSIGAILGDLTRVRAAGRYSNARGRSVGPIVYGPGDDGTLADTEDYSAHVTFDQTVNSWMTHSAVTTFFRNDQQSNDEIGDPAYSVFTLLQGTPGSLFPNSPRLVRLLDESEFTSLAASPSGLPSDQFLASSTQFDFPFLFSSEFRRNTFEYQANITWLGNQVLSTGYEYEREEDPLRKHDPTNSGFTIEGHSFFAQQQFQFADQWYATAGVRVDDNSRFGTEASPKLSVGGYPVAINDGTVSSVKVFANIGRGIKNPTFFELFGSGFVDGNPNLSPERATTVDTGAEFTLDGQRFLGRVTFFDNDYEDQVAFNFSPGFGGDGIPDYVNINGSQAQGVELEGGLQRPVGGLTALASYAFVDTEVVSNVSTSEQFQPGQPLLRRPKHSGNVRINYTHGKASVHLSVRMTGERHDAAFLGLRSLDGQFVDITVNPGYTLVGFGGQYRFSDALTLFLRAANLTDEEYESVLGYPGLPRAFVAGGRFNFGR